MMNKCFYRFKEGIQNLIKWFPIIWKDRQWDYHYLYIILHKKIELMEEFFESENVMAVNTKDTSEEMKLVKEALERLMNDDYLSKELIEYDVRYKDMDLYKSEKVEGEDYYRLVWTDNEEQMKEFHDAGECADKKEIEDINFVFSSLNKYIQKWWD